LQLTDIQGNWIRRDWLIQEYLTQNIKKLKLYFDWGLQENWVLGANRRMIKVLSKKEYEYKFIEFNGWHDWSNSRKIFPQGLIYLLD
jgi:enterochelin esterase-like enzyme